VINLLEKSIAKFNISEFGMFMLPDFALQNIAEPEFK